MSSLHRARRATPLFAIGLGLGLLTCLGNAEAAEPGTLPSQAEPFKIASAAPFEELRDTLDYNFAQPFGLEASAPVKGGLQNKWSVVKKKLRRESRIFTRCRADADACPPEAKRFLAIVDKALTREGWARIGEINRAINLNIRPVDDMKQYGVLDRWATPLMTFASNAGDCEDYAIAKYVALHEVGIDEDDLRLVVVHDHATNEDHAVAAVRYGGRWLILDNRTLDIRQDVDIAQFDPMFVIDKNGVKRMTASASKSQESKTNISPAAVGSQFSSSWPSAPLLL
jgi:predicted transglutaminase-like cysteine proteinase